MINHISKTLCCHTESRKWFLEIFQFFLEYFLILWESEWHLIDIFIKCYSDDTTNLVSSSFWVPHIYIRKQNRNQEWNFNYFFIKQWVLITCKRKIGIQDPKEIERKFGWGSRCRRKSWRRSWSVLRSYKRRSIMRNSRSFKLKRVLYQNLILSVWSGCMNGATRFNKDLRMSTIYIYL